MLKSIYLVALLFGLTFTFSSCGEGEATEDAKTENAQDENEAEHPDDHEHSEGEEHPKD